MSSNVYQLHNDDAELKNAANIEAILEWVDQRRPDCSDHIRDIIRAERRHELNGRGMLMLLIIGFVAGRNYQHKHPTLNPDYQYHR